MNVGKLVLVCVCWILFCALISKHAFTISRKKYTPVKALKEWMKKK